MSRLKGSGDARNPSRGRWEITEAGKARLEREGGNWDIKEFQTSKATVKRIGLPGEEARPTEWSMEKWYALRDVIDTVIYDSLTSSLRPELGASPSVRIARNAILYGPPGTGKTYIALQVAKALAVAANEEEDSRLKIVQFHPSYAYEDFIQGLKPDLERAELRYALKQGPFMEVCDAASDDPDNYYVLVIDEINRGDPARIFGELLYALEYRNEPVDLPQGGQLVVPPNLVVIGTMNSVDRSIAIADFAFRRRFSFVRVDPDPKVILKVRASPGARAAVQVLLDFNEWLTERLDVDHALGHSYFLNPATGYDAPEEAFASIWQLHVLPLLEEYFFGDLQSLEEARKTWDECVQTSAEIGDDEETEDGEPGQE